MSKVMQAQCFIDTKRKTSEYYITFMTGMCHTLFFCVFEIEENAAE